MFSLSGFILYTYLYNIYNMKCEHFFIIIVIYYFTYTSFGIQIFAVIFDLTYIYIVEYNINGLSIKGFMALL